MVSALTKSTLYNTFEIVKTILKNSTILTGKFSDSNFYEIDPNFESNNFKGFPCIIIESPDISDSFRTFKTNKEMNFSILISLYVEYTARDKFDSYSNEITYMINSKQDDLESYRLYEPEIISSPPDLLLINNTQVLKRDITVNFKSFMGVE